MTAVPALADLQSPRQHKRVAGQKQVMASHVPKPNVPKTRAALVETAANNKDCPWYLSGLPVGVLQTLDVAVIVGGQVLPAHSFVLMAMSPVFCEALSTQLDTLKSQQVLQLSLAGSKDTSEELTLALEHMYYHCMPRPGKAGLSFKTALVLLRFGHKYNAPIPFGDAYMHPVNAVSKSGILWLETSDSQTLDLVQMVDITNAAEEFQSGLRMVDNTEIYKTADNISIQAARALKPSLLDLCIRWFTGHWRFCRQHQTVMHRLSKTTMLKMWEHGIKLPVE